MYEMNMAEGREVQYMSESLAGEAYTSDSSSGSDALEWIIFNPAYDDLSKFDAFLEEYKPSITKLSDGIEWICVRSPQFESVIQNDRDDDREGLENAWKVINESGQKVTFKTVFEIALEHKVLNGKWLFHIDTGIKVDLAWAAVARAVVSGHCGTSAKISPRNENENEYRHVVCVYNSDFTDQRAVYELDSDIRRAGIKCHMTYKPDAFTYLGIYKNNRWGLRPTIYASQYDLMLGKSKIVSNF